MHGDEIGFRNLVSSAAERVWDVFYQSKKEVIMSQTQGGHSRLLNTGMSIQKVHRALRNFKTNFRDPKIS